MSTDSGRLYCFGDKPVSKPVTTRRRNPMPDVRPGDCRRRDKNPRDVGYQQRVLCRWAVVRSLASQLARNSELFIFAIDPDPARVADAVAAWLRRGCWAIVSQSTRGESKPPGFPSTLPTWSFLSEDLPARP
ncbi:MAG: hypothetical protein CM1200mP2_49640 [Planctomycetaceae bacterium]|nr:MAG: hypothetical protein CM1200mP2_49640 [Planctomycetaceae bacterium]